MFSADDPSQNQIYAGIVRKVEYAKKRSLWGYMGDDWVQFIKITVLDPRSLPKVRDKCSPQTLFIQTCLTILLSVITPV